MKFLADMGISPKTVSFLNSLAHDAVHLKDQGLQRAFDSFILEKESPTVAPDIDIIPLDIPSIILYRLPQESS
jgi:predicted nuclease of predicted toxin-antitoxin system